MTRGKQKSLPTGKPNLISSEVYTGALSRKWQGEHRYSISKLGVKPYTTYSSKSLAEMQERHKGAIVTQLK